MTDGNNGAVAFKIYLTGGPDDDPDDIERATLAFRNDQYLWWQVAEYTFDNFGLRYSLLEAEIAPAR